MDWIPVERRDMKPLELCLVCGRDELGVAAIGFGYWDDGWHLTDHGFTPRFYIAIEWPPELVDDGEGL